MSGGIIGVETCSHCGGRIVWRLKDGGKGVPTADCETCGIQAIWHGYRSHFAICEADGCKTPEAHQDTQAPAAATPNRRREL